MKPKDLILRCYAERKDGQWQAFCLDLCLAAQGESFEEVKRSLEAMIREYVVDALAGVDKEFAGKLLRRPAPLKYWLAYYAYLTLFKIGVMGDHFKRLFIETMPLIPAPVR